MCYAPTNEASDEVKDQFYEKLKDVLGRELTILMDDLNAKIGNCNIGYEEVMGTHQEIIKVRELIPHIGPLTKVIPLKLFLDIAPSSCEDLTRAMRGQPKRLTRNYLRKNGGNVILYVLVSFHTGYVFCTLSRLFAQSGISFVFLLVWLFIILPFGFIELN